MGETAVETGNKLEIYEATYKKSWQRFVVDIKNNPETFKNKNNVERIIENQKYSIAHLNAGGINSEADVYSVSFIPDENIKTASNDSVVVKIYHEAGATDSSFLELTSVPPAEILRSHALAHLDASGIDKVPGLIAFSEKDLVMVMTEMPGKSFYELSSNPDRSPLTQKQIEQLIDTMVELFNRNITVEPNPGNFLLSEFGVSVLDICKFSEEEKISALYNIASLYNALRVYCENFVSTDSSADEIMNKFGTDDGARAKFFEILNSKFPSIVKEMESLGVVQNNKFVF